MLYIQLFDSDTKGDVQSLTRLLSVLVVPLGSGIKHYLLNLLQLFCQTGKVEVCALFCHSCKLCESTQDMSGTKRYMTIHFCKTKH